MTGCHPKKHGRKQEHPREYSEALERARQHPSPTFVRLKDYPASFGEPDEAFVKEWDEKREAWAAKRTPTAPERVYDLKESLGIDEALKSRIDSPRAPRIRSDLIAHVVPIGRYALDAAINEAVSQKELHPRQSELEPWSQITEASQGVVKALERLFRAIDPDGKEAEHFAPFIRQSRGNGGFEASKAGYRAAAESALRDARVLVEAKQIIGKLHADTLTRRDALVEQYPILPKIIRSGGLSGYWQKAGFSSPGKCPARTSSRQETRSFS